MSLTLSECFYVADPAAQASDLSSTTRLAKAAADLCYQARDYALLNLTINLLSKKHGQLKGVVQALVEQAMGWLEEIRQREGMEKWLELIETLRSITEGKVTLVLNSLFNHRLIDRHIRSSWKPLGPA